MTSELLQLLNSGFGFVFLLIVVLIACTVIYVMVERRLKFEIAAMRAQFESALDLKSAHLETGATSAKSERSTAEIPKPAKPVETGKVAAPAKADSNPAAPAQPQQTAEELEHETLVVIAAAVSAFLGKSVRLRSARLIQPSEGSAWAQQGRVFVQASHNLGIAHHG